MKAFIQKMFINSGLLDWIAFEVSKRNDQTRLSEYKRSIQTAATIGDSSRIENTTFVNPRQDKTRITIGNSCLLSGAELLIYGHGGEIKIGDHCFIGQNSRIWSAKKINIGNRVLISHNVNIHDNNSHPLNAEERHKDFVHLMNNGYPQIADYEEREIIIEDDVWLGFNATIMKGVKIGKGAIVGANSVVTKDIPDYAVVIGNPQRIIKNNP